VARDLSRLILASVEDARDLDAWDGLERGDVALLCNPARPDDANAEHGSLAAD
jgi:hypothetical protein